LLATPIVAAGWVVIASIYRSIRGESADQLLAKRRTPWGLRPTGSFMGRRHPPGPESPRSTVPLEPQQPDQETTEGKPSSEEVEKENSEHSLF
ncbi:MAG TPA: hypothetical protein VGN34_33745, partial [Ktedonobacteraceae bacterium]